MRSCSAVPPPGDVTPEDEQEQAPGPFHVTKAPSGTRARDFGNSPLWLGSSPIATHGKKKEKKERKVYTPRF